jgi:hypothetical protein
MKVSIGGVDYTAALDAVKQLEVVRKLNEPSVCRLWVTVSGGLAAPVRNQAIAVTGDDGTAYFTGYLALSPMPEYAGLGIAGPVYRYALEAVSDEVLLDTQLMPPSAGQTGVTAGQLVAGLVTRTGSTALRTTGLALGSVVGNYRPEPGASWSQAAGPAVTQARGAYRAVNGALSLQQVGQTIHVLSETSGSLELGNLALTAGVDRALANDVTVCGETEPVAYVTEYFLGDGTTTEFLLTETPYFEPAASSRIIAELFNEGNINLRTWSLASNGAYFQLGAGGLQFNGGTGVDGQTALVWNDRVEGGGVLLLEATGVTLSPGSAGTLAGLYNGTTMVGTCVAGFQVNSAMGSGALSVSALVQGVPTGPAVSLSATAVYTLRTRLWCPETARVTQAYRVVGDSGMVLYGANTVVAEGYLLMELQEFVDGVGATPVVLYDGAMGYVPGALTVAAASSLNLIGSMRSLAMANLGTGWVRSTVPGGTARTRPVGSVAQGAECHLIKTGSARFYTGFIPVVGEVLEVHYRSTGRAVGRAVNAASQADLQAAGMPPTSVWIGTATGPRARSSQDCRNAAKALVTAASSVSAAWSGTYKGWRAGWGTAASQNTGLPVDVWPGDALELVAPSMNLNAQVVVRQVTLSYGASQPDQVAYTITFSNDWANDLSIKTSKTVPAETWLPALIAPTYLANLNQLTVTAMTSATITVAANATPPIGGGFEVRRRDFAFQPGQDADLVLRTLVPNFDIPRATEADRFYVRMYDASTPPNYSEFSAGIFVNLPLATTLS